MKEWTLIQKTENVKDTKVSYVYCLAKIFSQSAISPSGFIHIFNAADFRDHAEPEDTITFKKYLYDCIFKQYQTDMLYLFFILFLTYKKDIWHNQLAD